MFQIKKYADKHDSVGLWVHSFSTFDRVQKWGEDSKAEDGEKPYSIRVGSKSRQINLYAMATTKFDTAC